MEKSSWLDWKSASEFKLRILTTPVKFFERFNGKGKRSTIEDDYSEGVSVKYLTWAVDYTDGKIVLCKLPSSVATKIFEFKNSGEYKFEEFPMPYDVTVTKTGIEKETRYATFAARTNSDLSTNVIDEMGSLNDCAKILEAMKRKQSSPTVGTSSMAPVIEYPKNDLGDPGF